MLIALTTPTLAAGKCSSFEATVFSMTDEAMRLRKNRKFQEYGWSAAGPTKNWIGRWHNLSDEKMHDFLVKYGFILGDVYNVVDEYRTEGYLDNSYAEIEERILTAKRCK